MPIAQIVYVECAQTIVTMILLILVVMDSQDVVAVFVMFFHEIVETEDDCPDFLPDEDGL